MDDLSQQAPVTCAALVRHVFVCSGTACSQRNSATTLEALKQELDARGLLYGKGKPGKLGRPEGSILVTTCGSIGLCAVGPAVMVYPDGVWYAGVTPEDVPELVETHLVQGHILHRLCAKRFMS